MILSYRLVKEDAMNVMLKVSLLIVMAAVVRMNAGNPLLLAGMSK